jgi:hypothetical protein
VKRFAIILFAVLLVVTPLASVPAALAACGKSSRPMCVAACCKQMPCCTATPGNSQPVPMTTAPAPVQNEIFLSTPALIAWLLPDHPVSLAVVIKVPAFMASGPPIFARHCSLLI